MYKRQLKNKGIKELFEQVKKSAASKGQVPEHKDVYKRQGLGTACEQLGDLDQLKAAYQEWPFCRTFIDNIEMSIAKTDQRIAKMYLHLGDRCV